MCGIVGLVRRTAGKPLPDRARAARVLSSLQHRGPDTQGTYSDGNLWFGHLRLSIIDLSAAGNQPMTTADENLVIVYNGEVYNFKDLAAELSLANLRSSADTEVILRAFEKLGVASFAKLNGMFAFAAYDRRAQKLWLVRDRLGIKPLYYRFSNDGLFFGSEIKSIAALIDEEPACYLSSLHEWLYYGNTLGGRTLYDGIQQLQPGHYLELDLTSFSWRIEEYWSLRRQANRSNIVRSPSREIISETRRLLEEAVRRQLVSDVPIGIFLSGGVDSSAITAIAARHYNGRLATYSVGFDDLDGVDERPKARRVAAHFGTDHHELYIAGGGLADLVEKMVRHHDMPFSDAANIPLYLMAAQISTRTKVVLQGDGGDVLFGGYRRYVSLKYRGLMRPLARWGRGVEALMPDSYFYRRVRRYLHAYAANDLATTMARLLTPVDPDSVPEAVFSRRIREEIGKGDPFARYRECQPYFAHHDIGNQMSLVDLMIELPDIFLEKVDRSTMAASLEVRVPFLDHDLVDYVVRIPGYRKMPWGRKKWLLKQALQGIVPHDILYGPKTGFNVPFDYWLRTALKPLFFDHLATFNRERPDVLEDAEVRRMYGAMEAGKRDVSATLWNLLNLMIWCNQSKITIRLAEPSALGATAIAGVPGWDESSPPIAATARRR
jgi:asparagine synthase (glutamine-hydrolysing)